MPNWASINTSFLTVVLCPPVICQTIKVSLKNDMLEHQSQRQGTYQRSSEINGRPSWISESQAIWYMPKWKKWAIGNLSHIGTRLRGISGSSDDKLELPFDIKSWEYWIGSSFKHEIINEDISVQCIVPGGDIQFLASIKKHVFYI